MVITLGQQYNVREKPTVILYTYINRHAGTPNKNSKNKTETLYCSTPSNMVVIIYYYIDCKDKANPWYLNRFLDGSITLGQEYNVGEKPTVILYTYIAGTFNMPTSYQ